MAYTNLAVQTPGVAGAALTFSAVDAANGNKVANDGRTFVEVVNGDSNPTTVTIKTGFEKDGYALADQAVTVAAGTRKHIGPFPMETFNQQSGSDKGYVLFDFSNGTSVTAAAFH